MAPVSRVRQPACKAGVVPVRVRPGSLPCPMPSAVTFARGGCGQAPQYASSVGASCPAEHARADGNKASPSFTHETGYSRHPGKNLGLRVHTAAPQRTYLDEGPAMTASGKGPGAGWDTAVAAPVPPCPAYDMDVRAGRVGRVGRGSAGLVCAGPVAGRCGGPGVRRWRRQI